MNRLSKTLFGLALASAFVVGAALPAQAAGSSGIYCPSSGSSGALQNCTGSTSAKTTAGPVRLNYFNSNAGQVSVSVTGPNGYYCNLTGGGSSGEKWCPSVAGGTLNFSISKPYNRTASASIFWN